MAVKKIDRDKLREYNIYAGLGGSFGGAKYQYTTLCASMDEAEDEAYQAASREYDMFTFYDGVRGFDEALEEARENIDDGWNLDDDDPDLQSFAEEIYHGYMDDWCQYYAVPTDEDTDIDKENLIRDYVVDDNNTGEASCE